MRHLGYEGVVQSSAPTPHCFFITARQNSFRGPGPLDEYHCDWPGIKCDGLRCRVQELELGIGNGRLPAQIDLEHLEGVALPAGGLSATSWELNHQEGYCHCKRIDPDLFELEP